MTLLFTPYLPEGQLGALFSGEELNSLCRGESIDVVSCSRISFYCFAQIEGSSTEDDRAIEINMVPKGSEACSTVMTK